MQYKLPPLPITEQLAKAVESEICLSIAADLINQSKQDKYAGGGYGFSWIAQKLYLYNLYYYRQNGTINTSIVRKVKVNDTIISINVNQKMLDKFSDAVTQLGYVSAKFSEDRLDFPFQMKNGGSAEGLNPSDLIYNSQVVITQQAWDFLLKSVYSISQQRNGTKAKVIAGDARIIKRISSNLSDETYRYFNLVFDEKRFMIKNTMQDTLQEEFGKDLLIVDENGTQATISKIVLQDSMIINSVPENQTAEQEIFEEGTLVFVIE